MATKNTEDLNLSDVQEMIAKVLAEAKAEAAKIAEEAKAEAAKIVEEAKAATNPVKGLSKEEMAKHQAEMDELVEVKLFKDTGKYKDDVFVGVNGETIAIKRGERVKIKRKFAEVLDHSEHQDYETAELISRKASEWEKANQ